MPNPVLVEVTRGDLVESFHCGAFALATPDGRVVSSAGDIERPIYPRSAIKAFQALPVVESGAAAQYGFGARELALVCASHSGTEEHTGLAADMLRRCGLSERALACGAHDPVSETAARKLHGEGIAPSRIHNNCSGKHAGMVATCVQCGDPVANYCNTEHPHQRRIARALADMTGADIARAPVGIDGCSAPNWAIPLRQLAIGFARYVTGSGLTAERAHVCREITEACMAHSGMVAGPGRLDTVAMGQLPGRVFMKTGAEAVYCGAFPESGLGFALKIDDGTKRASEALMAGLIQRHLKTSDTFGALGTYRNYAGLEVGEIRLADEAQTKLDILARK